MQGNKNEELETSGAGGIGEVTMMIEIIERSVGETRRDGSSFPLKFSSFATLPSFT